MKKILVLEDDDIFRLNIVSIIGAEGFEVESVTGVKEGIEQLIEKHFDLVLSDWTMLDGTGEDVLQYISKNDINTPVFILSGYDDNEIIQRAMSKGAAKYLNKGEASLGKYIVEHIHAFFDNI